MSEENLYQCFFCFLLQNFVIIFLSIIYKTKRKDSKPFWDFQTEKYNMRWFCIKSSLCFDFTGKSKDEEKKLSEEEEEKKALAKYLSMDYRTFRRRRPVHNKALPLDPW